MVDPHEGFTENRLELPSFPINWQAIGECIASDQYAHAIRLLLQAEQACRAHDQLMQANLLAMLRQVCFACSQMHSQAEWIAHIQQESRQREAEFKQLLGAMLHQLTNDGHGADLADMGAGNGPVIEAGAGRSGWGGIRHLVQALFGWPVPDLLPPAAPDSLPASPAISLPLPPECSLPRPDESAAPPQADQPAASTSDHGVNLAIYCFGQFQVYQNDVAVEDVSSRKGRSVLKYLLLHRKNPVPREVLMDCFWPESMPDAARNNLNVAVYNLRQALHKNAPNFSHILFQDGMYCFNPEMNIWIDFEEFQERARQGRTLEQAGQLRAAMNEYAAAEALYQGDCLQEDIYEDWSASMRQGLRDIYINVLDSLSDYYLQHAEFALSITTCHKILTVEPCVESVHRRLMCAYSRQGQRYLALRQYHLCERSLADDLAVPPSQATRALFDRLRNAEQI